MICFEVHIRANSFDVCHPSAIPACTAEFQVPVKSITNRLSINQGHSELIPRFALMTHILMMCLEAHI